VDIYSRSLADLHDPTEFTISAWLKVSGAGIWTDATVRRPLSLSVDGSNNYAVFGRTGANNQIFWSYVAAANAKHVYKDAVSTTDWFHVAMTVSASNDRLRGYYAGLKEGADVTGLGAWAGTIVQDWANIGSINSAVQWWSGDAAHVAVWRKELTAAQVLALATPSGQTATIQSTEPDELVGYWPLDDPAGASTARDLSPQRGKRGIVVDSTRGQPGAVDGKPSMSFDGSDDGINVYGLELNNDWDGDELTVSGWLRVSGAGVWTDGTFRRAIFIAADATENRVALARTATNNQLQWIREGSNDGKQIVTVGNADLGWFHMAITVTKSGDELNAYKNGESVAAAGTSLGAWSGALSKTLCEIGAGQAGTSPWDGWLAYMAVHNVELSATQIRELYRSGVR
jgi:hypothetical protein